MPSVIWFTRLGYSFFPFPPVSLCSRAAVNSLWASPEECLQHTAEQMASGFRVLMVCSDPWAWGDQLLLKAKVNILENFTEVLLTKESCPCTLCWAQGVLKFDGQWLGLCTKEQRAGKLLLQFKRMFPQARKIHSLTGSYSSEAAPTPATTL